MPVTVEVAAKSENQLGEGILWDDAAAAIRWTDIHGRRLWRWEAGSARVSSIALPDRLACFAPLADGTLLAGFADGLHRFDPATGARTAIADIAAGRSGIRLNDGKLDRDGRLVFGTMHESDAAATAIAEVWSYAGVAGQGPIRLFDGVRISNSIAFSPDGTRMYFADTPQRTIWHFRYDRASGAVSDRRVFVQTGNGYPDGSCVDADGCLWNAEWDGGRVVRYAPDGSIDRIIEFPASRMTCPAFGGTDLSTLFVTSARAGLDAQALAREPLAGSLFAVRPGVSGLRDTAFAGLR
jgi:L-arabinonolactonase